MVSKNFAAVLPMRRAMSVSGRANCSMRVEMGSPMGGAEVMS